MDRALRAVRVKPIWIFAIIGVVVIVATAIGGDSLVRPDGLLREYHVANIWQTWDLAAAVWSFTFFVYYAMDYEFTAERMDMPLLILLIVSSFTIPIFIVAFSLEKWHNPLWTILLTFALNLVYLVIDSLLAYKHKSAEKRCGYKEAFLLADIPIVLTNLCFILWLVYHQQPAWETFASGMVGFQMVSCNIIFVITQLGFVRKVWVDFSATSGHAARAEASVPRVEGSDQASAAMAKPQRDVDHQ